MGKKLKLASKPEDTYTLCTTSVTGNTVVQYGLTNSVVKHWLAAYLIDETVVTFYVQAEQRAIGACTCHVKRPACPVHPNVPKRGVR
jgi:hypothetical protein